MKWEIAKLGEVAQVGAGQAAPQKAEEFGDVGTPFIRAGSLERLCAGASEDELEKIPEEVAKMRRMKLYPQNTIVFAKSGMSATLGRVYKLRKPCYIVSHLATIIAGDKTDADFLSHFFQSSSPAHLIKDLAYPSVSLADISDWKVPLPPLDEQKRIAAVLDRADALRRQRQESLQLTEKLLQSVFIKMFVRNPASETWDTKTVGQMAKANKGSIRTGPFGSQLLHSEFVDSGVAVLGIDNAVKNRFEWSESRFITQEKYEGLKRYKVFPGDIIITIMGTCGKCAIVPQDIPEAINSKHLCCITLDTKKCLPEFLHACFLNHPQVLQQLGVRAKGAVMPGLNMGIIKELAIPLPPIELQEKFKQVTETQLSLIQNGEAASKEAEHLFSSLQQRAFRGELDLTRLQ